MALRLPAWLLPPGLRLLQRFVYNPTVPFAQQRSRAEAVLRLSMRVPRSTTLEDFDVGGVRGLRVAAQEADPARRVVHLYGGAYCIGSTTMARSFAHWSARSRERSSTSRPTGWRRNIPSLLPWTTRSRCGADSWRTVDSLRRR